jgi:hypothetical protein
MLLVCLPASWLMRPLDCSLAQTLLTSCRTAALMAR